MTVRSVPAPCASCSPRALSSSAALPLLALGDVADSTYGHAVFSRERAQSTGKLPPVVPHPVELESTADRAGPRTLKIGGPVSHAHLCRGARARGYGSS
jgi:hypothetical protein